MLVALTTFTILVNYLFWYNVYFLTPDAPYFASRLETVLESVIVATLLWVAISSEARHSQVVWILLAVNCLTWWLRPAYGA